MPQLRSSNSFDTRIYEAIEVVENYLKTEKDEQLIEKAQENLKSLKSRFKIAY